LSFALNCLLTYLLDFQIVVVEYSLCCCRFWHICIWK